jgi:hypothetical protein
MSNHFALSVLMLAGAMCHRLMCITCMALLTTGVKRWLRGAILATAERLHARRARSGRGERGEKITGAAARRTVCMPSRTRSQSQYSTM